MSRQEHTFFQMSARLGSSEHPHFQGFSGPQGSAKLALVTSYTSQFPKLMYLSQREFCCYKTGIYPVLLQICQMHHKFCLFIQVTWLCLQPILKLTTLIYRVELFRNKNSFISNFRFAKLNFIKLMISYLYIQDSFVYSNHYLALPPANSKTNYSFEKEVYCFKPGIVSLTTSDL